MPLKDLYFWETECTYCGKSHEEEGYVVVERDTYDLMVVCKKCYDDAPEDTWGLVYLEWS